MGIINLCSRHFLSLAFTLTAFAVTGCATWKDAGPIELANKLDMPDGVPWKSKKPRSGTPRRMVATWTDTVKHQPGVEAERGFGGRIYFYDADESQPIKVEGQLVVYAFDETDRLPTDNRPNKRYVFPAEQFAKHESVSELGASYSVWLPWDKVGGAQTDVSLIARFEPVEGGALIVSEQARERLPGALTDQKAEVMVATSQAPAGRVVPAGYEAKLRADASAPSGKPSGLKTTTIRRPSTSVTYGGSR